MCRLVQCGYGIASIAKLPPLPIFWILFVVSLHTRFQQFVVCLSTLLCCFLCFTSVHTLFTCSALSALCSRSLCARVVLVVLGQCMVCRRIEQNRPSPPSLSSAAVGSLSLATCGRRDDFADCSLRCGARACVSLWNLFFPLSLSHRTCCVLSPSQLLDNIFRIPPSFGCMGRTVLVARPQRTHDT